MFVAAVVAAGIAAVAPLPQGRSPVFARVSASSALFVGAPPGWSFDDLAPGRHRGEVVVAATDRTAGLEPQRLFVVQVPSRRIRRLQIPVSRRCGAYSDQFPQRLHDGRLAFVRYCLGRVGSPVGRSVRLLVLDEATHRLSRFVPYQLPFFVRRFAISRGGRGVINDGRGLSERLQWLRPAKLQAVRGSWTRVGDPAWSPDGTRLAVATTQYGDRSTAPPVAWALRLLGRDGAAITTVLTGIADPSRPSWSPDGRRIALRMTLNGSQGLFVIDLGNRSVRLVRRGRSFSEVLWSPDGHVLYATMSRARAARHSGLQTIDLP